MSALGTRTKTLVSLAACALTVTAASCDTTKGTAGPDISVSVAQDQTFASLREAAERGAIDSTLVDLLEQHKAVDAFAILDGAAVRQAYADGNDDAVKKAGELTTALRAKVDAAIQVEVLKSYNVIPEMLVRLTDAPLALRLLNLREVLSITADHQNVTQVSQSLPLIGQPRLNALGLDGRGISVAVLDTGADISRAEFGACTAPGDPANTCKVPVAFDIAPNDGVADTTGHGTNVAAIVAGVAPAARIIPIDVHVGTYAMDHDVLSAIDWVLANRALYNIRAVNMSFGVVDSHYTNNCGDDAFIRNPFTQAFSAMRQARILPVIAAGNYAVTGGAFTSGGVVTGGTFRDGIARPACTAGAVAVGATYDSTFATTLTWGSADRPGCTDIGPPVDMITCISQDAPILDVLAPGARISAGGRNLSGTSQAAPHVSGAVAVLAQANPSASADQMEAFLKTSAVTITDSRAGSAGRSHPRLDLPSALRAAVPVPNDSRSAATPLTGWNGRLEQLTWAATKESGEPNHAGDAGGASVWFSWTAPRAGNAIFSTSGSGFDTVLAAYAPGSTTSLAFQDGAGGSIIQLAVNAGDVVHIAVDGDQLTGFPAVGALRFTWNLPNDGLAEAWPITPNVAEAGSNVNATHEIGEPHHCGDTFATASVWYRFTPIADATARIRASGQHFLCVAVYRTAGGAFPVPALSQQAGVASEADDSGPPIDFTFAVMTGNTYWIAVDGVSVETGCSPSTGQCTYTTPTGTFQLDLTTA